MFTVFYCLGLCEKKFWTSGNDLASAGGDFFWMANGQPLTYTAWLKGEPNRIGEERCIEIWNGIWEDRLNVSAASTNNLLRWNNAPCYDEKYFVCERFLRSDH